MCTISIALIANACKRVWLELFESNIIVFTGQRFATYLFPLKCLKPCCQMKASVSAVGETAAPNGGLGIPSCHDL